MTHKTPVDGGSALGRRPFLKTVGAGLAGSVLLAGGAAAHPQFPRNNGNVTTTFGEGVDVVGDTHEDVWTFATTNRAGKPMMMGVWMTGAAFDAVTSGESAHLHLDLPDVDGVNVEFAGVDWNEAGHPPAPVWTVPHFDFHFYLLDEADVAAIPFGVATYDLPDEIVPEHYVTEDPCLIIPGMGEHLFDGREADDTTATHTMIYGAYDPDIDPSSPSGSVLLPFGPGGALVPVPTYEGDGTGELTFLEPMVTETLLSSLRADEGELQSTFPTPGTFAAAGYYPTAYVVRYLGREDAFLVTLEEFEWVDATGA